MNDTVICKQCGTEFKRRRNQNKNNDSNLFCSRACGFKGQRRGKTNSTGAHCLVYFKTCDVCSLGFVARSSKIRVCSDECRKRDLAARTRVQNASKKAIGIVECKECGKAFVATYGNKSRMFCSIECGSKHSARTGKAKRRARIRGANVLDNINPFLVFADADWKCANCGTPTPMALRGKNMPDSPELDHILPISKGGTHTRANVQCLCRRCNQEKGAKIQ